MGRIVNLKKIPGIDLINPYRTTQQADQSTLRMEDDNKLDRDLQDLQKQLAAMSGSEDQDAPADKLDAELKALQQQLGSDLSDEDTKTQPKTKQAPITKPQTPIPNFKDEEEQPEDAFQKLTKNKKPTKPEPANEPTPPAKLQAPDVVQVNSLFTMEQCLREYQDNLEFCAKILNKKEKYLDLVKQGKINVEFYKKSLKNSRTSKHPQLAKFMQNEMDLIKKFPSVQMCFDKIVAKCLQSVPEQRKRLGKQYIPIAQPPTTTPASVQKPGPSKPIPSNPAKKPTYSSKEQELQAKLLTPTPNSSKTERQYIQKLDAAPNPKKLEMLLRALSRVQSLYNYYTEHMGDQKAYQLKQNLGPKRSLGMKLAQALLADKKGIPVGDFIVNKIGKVDFEKFHDLDRKDYQTQVDTLIKQIKNLDKVEKDLKRKCMRNPIENQMSLLHSNEVIENYDEYCKYLSAARAKNFQPLPVVNLQKQEREVYFQNLKLDRRDLQICLTKIEGIDHATLRIYFDDMGHSMHNTDYHRSGGEDGNKYQHLLRLTDDQMKSIDTKSFKLRFETKKMLLFTAQLATAEFKLTEFRNKSTITGECIRGGTRFSYELNIRLPKNRISVLEVQTMYLELRPEYAHTPEYQQAFVKAFIQGKGVIKSVIQIKKDGGVAEALKEFHSHPQININKPKIEQQPEQEKQVEPQPKMDKKPSAKIPPLFFVVRSEDSLNKLLSLEHPQATTQQLAIPQIHSMSIDYLNKMEQVIDKAINERYPFKVNKQILEELEDEVMKKKMLVQSKVKKSRDLYVQELIKSIKLDRIMKAIYQQNQLDDFVKFIQIRMAIVLSELQGLGINLEQQVQGSKEQKKTEEPSVAPVQPQAQSTQVQQPPAPVKQPEITKPSQVAKPLPSQKNQIDISKCPLKFARRTPAIRSTLSAVSSPIDNIEADKIRNPQKYSHSLKYLAEIQKVLDSVLDDCVGDKQTRTFVEDLSDQLQKMRLLLAKKKATITPEQYKTLLKAEIEVDRRLYNIYKKLELPTFQEFILGRIRLTKQQVGEPATLQLLKEASFDTNKQMPLFDLSSSPTPQSLANYPQDIKHPELPQYCKCMSYLEKMLEVATSQPLKTSLEAQKAEFEKAGAEGTLDPEQYAANLRKQRDQDVRRLEVYRNLDLELHYHFVKARLKIVDQELQAF